MFLDQIGLKMIIGIVPIDCETHRFGFPIILHALCVLSPFADAAVESSERAALACQKMDAFVSLSAVKRNSIYKSYLASSLRSVSELLIEPNFR